MGKVEWTHLFIWIGIGSILVLGGIIISSIRRKHRRNILDGIPRQVMTVFKTGLVSKGMRRMIDQRLEQNLQTKFDAAPTRPSKPMFGWTHPDSDFGSINFQQVILASPKIIEQAALVHSNNQHKREATQTIEDYLMMLADKIPGLDRKVCLSYLDLYELTRYGQVQVNKREYSVWLKSFLRILEILDNPSNYKSTSQIDKNNSSEVSTDLDVVVELSNQTKRSKRKKKTKTQL